MDKYEIEACQLLIKSLDLLIAKTEAKAHKEREKVNKAQITFKGEVYRSESELMEAYACDLFDDKTYDRLLEKLDKAKLKVASGTMTDSEMLATILHKYKHNLELDIAYDKQMKERQKQIDDRMSELLSQGYSITESKNIINNEERMRFE